MQVNKSIGNVTNRNAEFFGHLKKVPKRERNYKRKTNSSAHA